MKLRLREIRGKTDVEDFAYSISVSVDTIKSWEAGRRKPSDPMIERISRKYGYRIEWIKEGIEPKKNLSIDSGQAIMEILQRDRGEPYPEIIFSLGKIYAELDEIDRKALNTLAKKFIESMNEKAK